MFNRRVSVSLLALAGATNQSSSLVVGLRMKPSGAVAGVKRGRDEWSILGDDPLIEEWEIDEGVLDAFVNDPDFLEATAQEYFEANPSAIFYTPTSGQELEHEFDALIGSSLAGRSIGEKHVTGWASSQGQRNTDTESLSFLANKNIRAPSPSWTSDAPTIAYGSPLNEDAYTARSPIKPDGEALADLWRKVVGFMTRRQNKYRLSMKDQAFVRQNALKIAMLTLNVNALVSKICRATRGKEDAQSRIEIIRRLRKSMDNWHEEITPGARKLSILNLTLADFNIAAEDLYDIVLEDDEVVCKQ